MSDPIQIELSSGVAVVRMRAGRANALGVALLDAIERAFTIGVPPGAHALVITGDGSAFCAGLALPDLIELDRAAMTAHIDRFGAVMRAVLTCPLPVVAAVNGHAIAGGCVLALMCDERLMAAGRGRIGLNEVQLGIGLPSIVVEPLRMRVAGPAFTRIALGGALYDPAGAAALGLVDQVVEPDQLERLAIERARELGRAPLAYAQIKRAILRPVLAAVDAHQTGDREAWLDTWFSDHARVTLRAAVARITAPR